MGEKLGKKHILSINLNLVTLHVTSNIFFFFSFEIKLVKMNITGGPKMGNT